MEYSPTDIYVWSHTKYKNNIIPEIPCLITSYLIDNPDKVNKYLNKKLSVDKLLESVALVYSKTQNPNLLKMIIEYVES